MPRHRFFFERRSGQRLILDLFVVGFGGLVL